ncbi:hypothetical protein K435DRAFT_809982 [Dendrothele bispora CBS 962.96]|uniref:Uncharacterized protein n=1 Tax=Dendrothele bispora (strain CBS 962.96) TaxID=1314807 RepID=A0A4V6T4Z4_DENBC|nr:hypothetical protein K435DRAFT_809982 [Dendrothele bispora CBS 962.96]
MGKCLVEVLFEVKFGVGREQKNVGLMLVTVYSLGWDHENGMPTSPTTLPIFPTEQEHSNLPKPSGIDGPLPNPLATLPVDEEIAFPKDPKHPVNPPKSSPPKQPPPSPSLPFLPIQRASRNTLWIYGNPLDSRAEFGVGVGAFSAMTTVVEDRFV